MGKRAASKPPASPSKAKKASQEAEVPAEEEVFENFAEQCSPVLELIAQAGGLSDSCQEMLAAMSSHCLKTTKADRHAYQSSMVEVLGKVVGGVQAEHVSAAQAAEAAVGEMATEKEAAAGGVAAALQAVEAATQARDAKEEASKSFADTATQADVALADARNSVAGLDGERAELVADKSEHEELLSGTWAQLKSGAIPGNKWRERAKLITGVVDVLDKIGLDASLKGGLPVALKAKPTDRGPFAEKAVDFAEGLLAKHVASMGEKLGGMEAEAARRAQAVVDAETTLAGAVQLKEAAAEALATAEADLTQKNKDLAAAKKAEKALEPKSKQLNNALEEAEASLEAVKDLVAKFEALCEGPAAAPPAPVDQPEAEAAAVPAEA